MLQATSPERNSFQRTHRPTGETMVRDPETLQILLDSIRQFVNQELIPREHEVAETDSIPADIVEQMKEMGLFGLTIPEQYGGLGVTMEEEVNIAFELGRTS